MQFLALVSRHPDKASTPVPSDLREAEFETVRGYFMDRFVQQIWLRGDSAGGACMIVEAGSEEEVAEKLAALPLASAGFLQAQLISPLRPYSGFAPRS